MQYRSAHTYISASSRQAGRVVQEQAKLANTLDPSPYLGMPLNISERPERPMTCQSS